jgi:hypothetical protein
MQKNRKCHASFRSHVHIYDVGMSKVSRHLIKYMSIPMCQDEQRIHSAVTEKSIYICYFSSLALI